MDLFYSNLYFFLALFLIQEISANLIKCEGFVKSFIDFDLSKIQIKLYTTQGAFVYGTASDSQGHFAFEIQNKGKYSVKIIAPEGYIFAPPYHELDVNDANDCSGELNFNLTGVTVSGTILNVAQDSSLVLGIFEQQNGNLIKQTNVDKEGHYSFVTKPGKYVIVPIDDSAQCLSPYRVEIEVTTFPVIVKPDIRVDGYSLTVFVKDEKGYPFPDAIVILLSDNEINFQNLPFNAKQPSVQNKGQKWFYEWKTDSSGSCSVNCLPPGKYILTAKTKMFNIEANFDEKSALMKSSAIEVTILLKSFNLFGHVSTLSGLPFKDVKINLDEKFKTQSDKEGKFVLTDVSVGKHTLEAEKEYFEFSKLIIDVSPMTKKEIRFFPIRMAICGQMMSADELDQIPFELTTLKGYKHSHFYTDSDGKFCEFSSAGTYLLKPFSNMLITPSQVVIELYEEPILNLRFIQFKDKKTTDLIIIKDKVNEATEKLLPLIFGFGSLLSAWGTFLGVSIGLISLLGMFFFWIYDRMNKINEKLRNMATKDDLRNFATKEDLRNFATKEDFRNFATKEDLRNFATKEDFRNFATKEDFRNFATKEELATTKKDLLKAMW